jgi:hypothetical protein
MPAGEIGAVSGVGSRPDVEGWSGFESALLDINQIRVGMWVAAENPEVSDAERRTFVDPDSATWRFLKLRLPKSADPRDFVEIEMLRPAAWLEQHTAEVGGRVLLDLEELGAKGWAEVLEIGPCPEIVPGPGSVVTATFAHQPTAEILDVTISVGRQSPGGLTLDQPSSQDTSSPASETIGVTANHPFWSVDHQAFVPVGLLEPGTRVKTHLDQIQTIVSLHPRPGPPEQVYNLEVHGEHVYYVGTLSILVHNDYVNTSDLNPTHRINVRNGRAKREFEELKADIKANGMTDPIKYVEYNGTKYVVNGHHRLRAARELGMKTVPAEKVELPYGNYKTVDDLLDYFNN